MLKTSEAEENTSRYERARMSPAVAAAIGALGGPIPSIFYGANKDIDNREINPYAEESTKIDPGKIYSAARNKHIREHSAGSILLDEQGNKMLIGGLGGAGLGAAAANIANALDYGQFDPMIGGLGGALIGGLGGLGYGSYLGANRYNDVLKKRLAERQIEE